LIILALVRFAPLRHYRKYLSLIVNSLRKPWLKALVLDLLLHDVHWAMFNQKKPHFSTLFLNAGAHIQHHYFFNAKPLCEGSTSINPGWYVAEGEDPLADLLDLYDLIVGEYFAQSDAEVLLATGLSQKPYDRVKFYYRLNAHADFLRGLGIKFVNVYPRMTRDFLIEFEDSQQALTAQNVLAGVRVGDQGIPLFGEIDNRGSSLFVTLTYPNEITTSTLYRAGERQFPLRPQVSFVAIKNGMHHAEGFAFFTAGLASKAPENGAHVAGLGKTILDFFGVTGSVDEYGTEVGQHSSQT
jgi:hypothetical protein